MADRLISADAPKANFPKDTDWDYPVYCPSEICELIDSAPTVEAEPIKHGHWIEDSEGWWHCSECGRQIPPKSKQDLNEFNKWCGRCGARMDGGENGTDQ